MTLALPKTMGLDKLARTFATFLDYSAHTETLYLIIKNSKGEVITRCSTRENAPTLPHTLRTPSLQRGENFSIEFQSSTGQVSGVALCTNDAMAGEPLSFNANTKINFSVPEYARLGKYKLNYSIGGFNFEVSTVIV